MNIQQIQYVLAVAEYKYFDAAAEKCFVTQSTLSTMIGRFEDEIGIKIFNRKTKPVSITQEGVQLIEQLGIINKEIDALDNLIQELKGDMVGEFRIEVIPTIAPYLLPLFLPSFAAEFPKVKIIVQESTTIEILKKIKSRVIDIGILAVPLNENDLLELPLYNEPFLLYNCSDTIKTPSVSIYDLDFSKLCLLQEGHCLRTQVQKLCDLSAKNLKGATNFEFVSASLDSLIRFTEASKGLTILPYLASRDSSKKGQLLSFESPVPSRSIGLVTHQNFVKKRLLKKLQKIIQKTIKPMLPENFEEIVLAPK